jgi:hypothetical protein
METVLSSEPIVKGVTEQDLENLLRKQPDSFKESGRISTFFN